MHLDKKQPHLFDVVVFLEVTPDLNRGIRVLQTLALPLGYVTVASIYYMQFEPKLSTAF